MRGKSGILTEDAGSSEEKRTLNQTVKKILKLTGALPLHRGIINTMPAILTRTNKKVPHCAARNALITAHRINCGTIWIMVLVNTNRWFIIQWENRNSPTTIATILGIKVRVISWIWVTA
jgi:hypothetical protein